MERGRPDPRSYRHRRLNAACCRARGDRAWVSLVQSHDEIVREHLKAYRGRQIDHTGDGFLAIFDGPARAVTCAARMVDALRDSA